MATTTPPPYFPQGSLAPPDAKRYRNFKLAVFGIAVLIVLALAGVGVAIWYLTRSLL